MQAIEAARERKVQDDLDAFRAQRFGRSMGEPIKAIHRVEEERPIETLWDVTVAATAHARSIPNNDKRLEIERAAGELLKLAALSPCPCRPRVGGGFGVIAPAAARASVIAAEFRGISYRRFLWRFPRNS